MYYLSMYIDKPIEKYNKRMEINNQIDYPSKCSIIKIILESRGILNDSQIVKQLNDLRYYLIILKPHNNIHNPSISNGADNYKSKFIQKISEYKRKFLLNDNYYLDNAVYGIVLGGSKDIIFKIKIDLIDPLSSHFKDDEFFNFSTSVFNGVDISLLESFCSLINRYNYYHKRHKILEDSPVRIIYDCDVSDYDYLLDDVIEDFVSEELSNRPVKDIVKSFDEWKHLSINGNLVKI